MNSGIGTPNSTPITLQCSIIRRHELTMATRIMKAFERYALAYFFALAITPMLAVAATGAIH